MTRNEDRSTAKVTISRDKLTALISIPVEGVVVNEESICQELSRAGVVFGLKREVIENFASSPSIKPVVVAEGVPPAPGTDERIELFFPTRPLQLLPDDKDVVDYRETSSVVSVEEGTLLAERHPGAQGAEGIGVTGEILPPPKIRTVKLQAGKGTVLSEDGNKIFSTVNGRPTIKEAGPNRIISCEPVYTHNGDVNIKTGNLRFKGDIRITGNVHEEMTVQALGNVEIMGLVTRATIISGAELVVNGNVIGSNLRSGILFPGAKKLSFMLRDVYSDLVNLTQALDQLKKQKNLDFSSIDFGRLVLGLMDSRFKNLRPMIKNILSFAGTESSSLPAEVSAATESLKCLSGLSIPTADNYTGMMKSVGGALELLVQGSDKNKSVISIQAALTSVIQSAGNVNVIGQGCLNTTVNAGGNVLVKGSFKGGEIFCEGNASIRELGSDLGIPPVVRVAPSGNIVVGKAYPGAVIQVGKRRVTLTREISPLRARLNSDDQLELY